MSSGWSLPSAGGGGGGSAADLTDPRTGVPLGQSLDGIDAEISALTTRLSADEALLTAAGLAITDLKSARDAHTAAIATAQTSIGALQTAVATLQQNGSTDEAAIAAAQAAITALRDKVTADEATAAALATTVGNLSAAQTADEAKIVANSSDIGSLKGSRIIDEAAIAAAQSAISALQAAKTTDEQAIANNAAAIAALQTAMASAQSAISANGTAVASLQSSRTADEATIASNSSRITAVEARPILPAGSAAKAGQFAVIQSDGTWGTGTPAAPPAAASGVETYISTVLVKSSTNSFDFASIVPTSQKGNRATIAIFRGVGGGGGGFARDSSDQNSRCPGGNPGQVTRRRRTVSSVPSPFAATIGAGGQSQGNVSGACLAGAGGDTSVPALDLFAAGGPGGYLFAGLNPPGQVHGDVTSGRPGQGLGNVNGQAYYGPHNASHGDGPGAGGGALANQTDGYQWGGNGGDSNVDSPSLRLAGGNGRAANGSLDRNGKDSTSPLGYGSGGGGAGFYNGSPGNGGFPGGGGGGGGAGSNGGAGVLAIDFYVVE